MSILFKIYSRYFYPKKVSIYKYEASSFLACFLIFCINWRVNLKAAANRANIWNSTKAKNGLRKRNRQKCCL